MCYLPVHSTMIYHLHKHATESVLTETPVYEKFTNYMVLRTRSPYDGDISHIDVTNDDLSTKLNGSDKENNLFKPVFKMTVESKQTFSQEKSKYHFHQAVQIMMNFLLACLRMTSQQS